MPPGASCVVYLQSARSQTGLPNMRTCSEPTESDQGQTPAQPSDSISEHILPIAEVRGLTAAGLRAEVLAEELHHMILKAVSHGAGVRAGIDLKAVRDSILVQNVVQFAGVDA